MFFGQSGQLGLVGKSRTDASAAPWWPNLILVVVGPKFANLLLRRVNISSMMTIASENT